MASGPDFAGATSQRPNTERPASWRPASWRPAPSAGRVCGPARRPAAGSSAAQRIFRLTPMPACLNLESEGLINSRAQWSRHGCTLGGPGDKADRKARANNCALSGAFPLWAPRRGYHAPAITYNRAPSDKRCPHTMEGTMCPNETPPPAQAGPRPDGPTVIQSAVRPASRPGRLRRCPDAQAASAGRRLQDGVVSILSEGAL